MEPVAVVIFFGLLIYHKKMKSKAAEYDYSNASLQAVMAMLVHSGYFRDLNFVGDFAATLLRYQNPKAEIYGQRYWEPLPDFLKPSWKSKSEAQRLGLHFFFRKNPHPNSNAPQLAIILRGTIPYKIADWASDILIGLAMLHRDSRVDRTEELISEVVVKFRAHYGESERISMAGHSLGSAIAFQVGKRLYLRGINIDTHLYSPPMLTFRDVMTFKAFEGSHVPYTARSGDDYCESWETKLSGNKALLKEWKNFGKLNGWAPHYYLNHSDPVSRLFIKYFTEGREMSRTAAQSRGFLSHLFSENPTLLSNVPPSAHVHISGKHRGRPLKAHNLRQWHKTKLSLEEFEVNLFPPY